MFKSKRKLDKKKAVSMIRRFLSGEDITREIVPMSSGLACLDTDELNKLLILKDYQERFGIALIEPGWTFEENGKVVSYEDFIEINEKIKSATVILPNNYRDPPSWATGGPILWAETKTYPDPTIPGIVYTNPETLKDIECSEPLAAPRLDDVTGRGAMSQDSARGANEPVNGLTRQDRINNMKLEALHIKEMMKARRDKMNQFTEINREFLGGWN